MPDKPSEEQSATHDAALAVLRAIVEEIKSLAHDPKAVHFCAAKLHAGIDALEKMLTKQEPPSASEH